MILNSRLGTLMPVRTILAAGPVAAACLALVACTGTMATDGGAKSAASRVRASTIPADEAAVRRAPEDAVRRRALGYSYLDAGRFAAADSAFADTLRLAPGDGKAALGRALALVAVGDRPAALALLQAHEGGIEETDYGLALVLAGGLPQGFAVLNGAAVKGDVDARARQNFAFALALTGQWVDARLVAAQDLKEASLHERMQRWAELAQSGDTHRIVAYLLNAPLRADPGMPADLALAPRAPTTLAANDPAPLALYAPSPVDNNAVVTPPVPEPMAAPVEMASVMPAVLPRYNPHNPLIAKPVRQAAAQGSVALQLGAFDDSASARTGWARLSRTAALQGYAPAYERVTVNGRLFVRLIATGLPSVGEAKAVCRRLSLNYCATRTGKAAAALVADRERVAGR